VLFVFLNLFRFNRYKTWITFCLFSAALLLWPAYIGCYSPRYFYEVHAFILMAFMLCFAGYTKGARGSGRALSKLGLASLGIMIAFFVTFTLHSFYSRQTKMRTLSTAIYQLAANPTIKNRALCFVSYPMDGFGAHPADILWILLNDRTIPILCDSISSLVQVDSNIVQRWGLLSIIAPYYDQDYVTVIPVEDGLRFVSSSPMKTYFFPSTGCSLGKKSINGRTEGFETDVTLNLDKQWLDYNPLFIGWSYEQKQFIIINP